MPIPPFTHEGILPPFIGAQGPGGSSEQMTPYKVSSVEVAHTFGTDDNRREILRGWLQHRTLLRSLGFTHGFQWVDGSFVEQKTPNDIDVVSFVWVANRFDPNEFNALCVRHPDAFVRQIVKSTYRVDQQICDFAGDPESIVGVTRYFLGLFSHRRDDNLWKGMLEIRLDSEADDITALEFVNRIDAES